MGMSLASGSTTLTYSRNALNRYMSDPFLETLEARIDFSNFSLSPLHQFLDDLQEKISDDTFRKLRKVSYQCQMIQLSVWGSSKKSRVCRTRKKTRVSSFALLATLNGELARRRPRIVPQGAQKLYGCLQSVFSHLCSSCVNFCDKRKRFHRKRVQLPQDWFGTPTWLPFQ